AGREPGGSLFPLGFLLGTSSGARGSGIGTFGADLEPALAGAPEIDVPETGGNAGMSTDDCAGLGEGANRSLLFPTVGEETAGLTESAARGGDVGRPSSGVGSRFSGSGPTNRDTSRGSAKEGGTASSNAGVDGPLLDGAGIAGGGSVDDAGSVLSLGDAKSGTGGEPGAGVSGPGGMGSPQRNGAGSTGGTLATCLGSGVVAAVVVGTRGCGCSAPATRSGAGGASGTVTAWDSFLVPAGSG